MRNSNEYMRNYMRKRYWSRRQEAIKLLGGKCVRCGTTENLEIDHKNPSDKSFEFDVATKVNHDRFLVEMAKCQLLCSRHHQEKTVIEDFGKTFARGTHGTLSAYRYCKCDECRAAKSESNRRLRSQVDTAAAS